MTTVKIPRPLWDQLTDEVELTGVSRPDIISHIIAQAFERPEWDPRPDYEQLRKRPRDEALDLDMTA